MRIRQALELLRKEGWWGGGMHRFGDNPRCVGHALGAVWGRARDMNTCDRTDYQEDSRIVLHVGRGILNRPRADTIPALNDPPGVDFPTVEAWLEKAALEAGEEL